MRVPFLLALRDLADYRQVVHRIAADERVRSFDVTVGAPLYKATDTIRQRLTECRSSLDKFDLYFEHGFLDEVARARFASAFRRRTAQMRPSVRPDDVFTASADVLGFSFCLSSSPDTSSHVDSSQRIHLRLFLDHVYNPRRADHSDVRALRKRWDRPAVVVDVACEDEGDDEVLHALLCGTSDDFQAEVIFLGKS